VPAIAPTENTSSARRVILPARLIPGNPLGGTAARRTKVSSTVLHSPAGRNDLGEVPVSQATALGQLIADALLPRPAKPSQRLALGTQVLVDFLLLAAGFSLSGLVQAILNAVTKQAAVEPIAVIAGKIELCLLTGTVFTLLGYSERLYHPETLRAPRQQILVLVKITGTTFFDSR
jgi:hypothetical protein